MKKNSLKKINKFVCCLVILSLFLQFVPARQPAKASPLDALGKWMSKLATKINIPSILLNEKGDIMLGALPLFKNIGGGNVNPFSDARLSIFGDEVQSQKALVEPAFIPGCLEAQKAQARKGVDLGHIQPSGPLKYDYSTLTELDPDYIAKQITGCANAGKPPCLEPQESVNGVIGCGNPKIIDLYALRGSPGCYDWYKNNDKGSKSDFSKDNVTWRLYWEEIARKFGTYENIKKAYIYCEENEPVCRNWQSLAEALTDLGGNVAVVDLTPQFIPKYKNLYEYNYPNGQPRNNTTIKSRHKYFLIKMSAIMPSFIDLASLNIVAEKLNWWGDDDRGTNSARRAIKTALEGLQAGIQADLKVFNLTLAEIKKAVDDLKFDRPPESSDCVNPKAGEVLVPKPYMLPQCELKIPLPGDAICDNATDEKCELKKLAQGKACTYLARLQDSAAQEVFAANKIFNATDPFTDCLFVRNCRSNCALRLGEVTFTVTLLDVAALFIPGGFLTVLQKILNIYKIINEAWKILTTVQELFDSGVSFLNQIFNVMGQVSSLFESFANSGLKMSDVLIYGGGAVASYFGGKEIQEIGKDKGGNIGWLIEKGGDTLVAGDGLVGGAAATLIFNTDRAKKASSGMQDMLAGFAQSNLKFATAKNEAIQFNATLKSDIDNVRQVFKKEEPIAFLFQTEENNAKKKEINMYLDDFYLFITRVDDFLIEIKQVASLKDGRPISDLVLGGGLDEWKNRAKLNDKWELKVVCDQGTVELPLGGGLPPTGDPNKYNCYVPDMVRPINGKINDVSCSWIDFFKTYSLKTNLKDFFELTDPEYIKKKITGCTKPVCLEPKESNFDKGIIGCDNQKYKDYAKEGECGEGNIECYRSTGNCVINEENKSWREYWEDFGKRVGTFENIKAAYIACEQAYPNCSGLGELARALTDLATTRNMRNSGSNYTTEEAKAFTQANVKYKNLNEYAFDYTNEGPPNDMKARHMYFIQIIVAMYPSLAKVELLDSNLGVDGETTGLDWWGPDGSDSTGRQSTRRAIKDALQFLQEGIKATKDKMLQFSEIDGITNNLVQCVSTSALPDVGEGSRFWDDNYFYSNGWPYLLNCINTKDAACAEEEVKNSYEGDAAYEDWDEKIKIISKYQPKFDDIKQALDLGLSPERPIVVYKAEKAKKYLDEIVAKVKTITGEDIDNLAELAKDIINQLITQIDKEVYGIPKTGYPNAKCSIASCPMDIYITHQPNCYAKNNNDTLRKQCEGGIFQTDIYGENETAYEKYTDCCGLGTMCDTGLDRYKDMYLGNADKGIKGYEEQCNDCLEHKCEYCPDNNLIVCDNDGRCDSGENSSNCPNDCDEVVKYKCSADYQCEVNSSGVSWDDCIDSCENPNPKFGCFGSDCRPDDVNGIYTTSNCDHRCGGSGAITCTYFNIWNRWCKCAAGEPCGSDDIYLRGFRDCTYPGESKADCESLGFLDNQQNLVKVKSVSPLAVNIIDNLKQRVGSFVSSLIKVPNVFAATVKYCYPSCGVKCKTTQTACEDAFENEQFNYCNKSGRPCNLRDVAMDAYKCFKKDEPIYNSGYKKYIEAKAKIDALLAQRQFLEDSDLKAAVVEVANMLSGAIDTLSDNLTELQTIWEAEMPFISKKDGNQQNQESITVRTYLERIIGLQDKSEVIMNIYIPNAQKSIENVETSIEIISRVMESLSDDSNAKNILKIIVDNFTKTNTIINKEVIQYAIDKIGPIGIRPGECVPNTKQFLYRLNCFEKDNKQVVNENGKTFKDLLSYMDVLRNLEDAGFKLEQVAKTLPLIEPSLDMEPLQLKSGLSDEISAKAQCCLKGCFEKDKAFQEDRLIEYNHCNYSETYIDAKGEGGRTTTSCFPFWTEVRCNQLTTLFTGQKEGESNYETFKTGLLANPLNTLQDNFMFIMDYLYSGSVDSVSALLKAVQDLMKERSLKGVDAGKKYSPILKNLADKSSMDLWEGLIWGNDVSENTRMACDAVTQVLGGNPEDIAKECKTRTTQEVKNIIDNVEKIEKINVSLLPPDAGGTNTSEGYDKLTKNCKLLSKMDVDVLENIANDPYYITNRIADLTEQRRCITRENCNFPISPPEAANPCIVCPKYFCLNETGTWAVLKSQAICEADPLNLNIDCKEDEFCKDIRNKGPFTSENTKDKQGDGLYYTNRIIWDTATHGALPPIDPNQNLVCNGLDLLRTDNCIIRKVNERCTLINTFLTSQTCDLFDKCNANDNDEINKQQRIQEWRKLSVVNQCPKWFCLKNNSLMWAGSTWITGGPNGGPSDSYCQAHCGANDIQNDYMICDPNGIIWDTNNQYDKDGNVVDGWRDWPPKKNWLGQPITSITAGGMVNNCILAQTGLQNEGALDPIILDSTETDCSPISPISEFCKDKNACITANNSCVAWVGQQDERSRQQQSAKPLMEWPPTTRCEVNENQPGVYYYEDTGERNFAQKYTGAQAMCIGTQQEIIDLNKLQVMIDDIETKTDDCPDCRNTAQVFTFLTNQCNKLDYQKAFARDCYDFSVLRQAFDNKEAKKGEENWKEWNKGKDDYTTDPPKWNPDTEKTSAGSWTSEKTDVENIKKAINGFCNIETAGKIVGKKLTFRNDYEDFKCGILGNNVGVDFTLNTDEAKTARELAGKICSESSSDMRTPLNEVMKVFSILLGIKSYTSAKNGLSTLYFDAQKMQKRVRDTVALIKGFPDKFMELWGQEDTISNITGANFDVRPLLCIEGPMTSYAGGGKKALTGPKGGQVCPDVSEQFSQLDTMFSNIRQNFRLIDLARKKPSHTFGFWEGEDDKNRVEIEIPGELIDWDLEEVVRPIYKRAESIKEKSQLLWALASAINFANENCACGQSFCPMVGKIPFCISGLPITLNPLKEPFCHLVWTLRYPLGSLAERLKQDIENPSE